MDPKIGQEEVDAIKEEIEHRMGPKQSAILVCVSDQSVSQALEEDMIDDISALKGTSADTYFLTV